MTHPTDAELEAMAVRLIHTFDTLSEADGAMEKAASMLLACKWRSAEKQAYIEGTQAGWDAAIEAAAKVAQGYGCCHVPQEIAEEIRALKEKPK